MLRRAENVCLCPELVIELHFEVAEQLSFLPVCVGKCFERSDQPSFIIAILQYSP